MIFIQKINQVSHKNLMVFSKVIFVLFFFKAYQKVKFILNSDPFIIMQVFLLII